jgi:serine/threonine protein kinase
MTPEDKDTLKPGTDLFGYRVIEFVSEGYWSYVYKAQHPKLPMLVAIKQLKPEWGENEDALRMFLREADILARLNHPNVLSVYDLQYDEETGSHYIITPFSEKGTLADRLKQRPEGLPIYEALNIATDICTGLEAIHQKGIVHRDVKPSNILFFDVGGGRDIAKLSDFGIAKAPDVAGMTQSSGIYGSLYYMSPEQLDEDKEIDHRSDLYCLGVLLYELLTGQVPFIGTEADVFWSHMYTQPRPLRELRPDIPEAVERIILRALHKNPNDRYESANDMCETIKAIFDPVTREKRLRQFEVYLKEGLVHLEKEEWEAAIEAFKRAENLNPGDQRALERLNEARVPLERKRLYELGVQYLEQENWEDAREYLADVISQDPNYANGQAIVQLERATRGLERERDQRDLRVQYRTGMGHFRSQQWQQAIAALEQVAAREPEFEDAADRLRDIQRYLRAERLYEQAQVCQEQEGWEKAIELLEEVEMLEPPHIDVTEELKNARVRWAEAKVAAVQRSPTRQCFLTVSHSARVGALVGDIVRLSLRLTPEYPGPRSIPIETRQGEVSFFIQAEGFYIQEGEDVITLSLPAEEIDFAFPVAFPATFGEDGEMEEIAATVELQARLPGARQITIESFYDGQRHQPLALPISVRLDERVERPKLPSPLGPRPVPQPDLCLRVYASPLDQDASRLRLDYVLYSPHFKLRLPGVPVGAVEVSTAQLARLRARLDRLLRRAAPNGSGELWQGLEALGRGLYDALFSPELAEAYRDVGEEVVSWLVLCDAEPWIPWELVKPHGPGWEHDFMGARYSLGRWVEGWGVSRQAEAPLGPVYFAPGAGLAGRHAREEWTQLLGGDDVPRLGEALLVDWPGGYPAATAFSSSVWGLHFEGYPERLAPALKDLALPGAERFSSEDVAQYRLNLRQKRPVVTFGMLALEQQSALSEVETRWMPTFIRSGASAFVAPLWATAPQADRLFWRAFYRALWARVPLGEALLAGRRALRQAFPDSADWLAYFMVGDPMTRGYVPPPGQGYVALECQSHDLAQLRDRESDALLMRLGETYSFLASVRAGPPTWYRGRLYQAQEGAWDDPQVYIFAPDFAAPQAPLAVNVAGDVGSVQFNLAPQKAGEHDVFVKFLAGEQVRQSLTLRVNVGGEREAQR